MKEKLLNWYDLNKKDMPWRDTQDPYRIWVSEVMLQQTQVSTVIPYYKRWAQKFPNIKDLAEADIDDILKLWEGLGYYRRAHNLKSASEIVISKLNGLIPCNAEFKNLPGVGDYIYAAVLSIAFNKPIPVIDGNVKRVFSRFYEQDLTNSTEIQKLQEKLLKLICQVRPGCFNQALMDLGREVCKPQNPKCQDCPISEKCKAYINKTVELYPHKTKKKKIPFFDVVVGYIENDEEKFIITKRPNDKMLGGLWELPGGKKEKGESLKNALIRELKEELNIEVSIHAKLGMIEHSYSHLKIKLHAYKCKIEKGKIEIRTAQELKWIQPKNIKQYSFPTANHKLFNQISQN